MLCTRLTAAFEVRQGGKRISTAVVAAKFETSSPNTVWGVTLLRRRRSMRLRLHVWPVSHDGPGEAGPSSGVIVGTAAAPGGLLLTLLASGSLACQRLHVRVAG
ncbi:unnamed protein product [Prorocentrum cordatum]|uniref:Uncharacterized protein n=1 Tax=Prorocentrum cordatum TaxID=2364126 RepID=A0ABN9SIB4_9DINO|nr:unnamed protein product [Polarella glacialis]